MTGGQVEATEAKIVGDWLQTAIGVPFVVVGGGAVAQDVPVATKDVDVLIDRRDWEAIDSAIETAPEATPLEPVTGTIRGTLIRIGDRSYELEFISAEPFSGRFSAETFEQFVREEGSTVREGIRYARPAVVFYMRLATDDWQGHVDAIERDLRAGVPYSVLDLAVGIAERFGVETLLRDRFEYVRKAIRWNSTHR
jgi:hypothetical protein